MAYPKIKEQQKSFTKEFSIVTGNNAFFLLLLVKFKVLWYVNLGPLVSWFS